MATNKWVLDPMHSELGFKIKHLMITNVSGYIKTFEAEAVTQDEDFSTAKITLKAQMATLSTNNEGRDAHLRNADFFEVETYPELLFSSTKVEKVDDDNYLVHGHLTMKGVSN